MSEETLSPLQAASALREAASWSEQLRRRTVGLTWLVWALVVPAIFVTYAWAALAAGPAWSLGLLWLPWSAGGLLVTALLWRSARVAREAPALSMREVVVHAALFLLATAGVALVVAPLRLPLPAPAAVLLGIGLLTAMLGAREAFGEERGAGIVQALAGLALLLFAVSQALAAVGPGDAALADALAAGIVLGAVGAVRFVRS